MTLPEKAAQMVRVPYAYVSREEARDWEKRGAGSFLHVMGGNAREIQQLALGTRLGIPGRFRCITTAYPAGTAGSETAQVCVRDLVGSVMSPVKRLVAFQKAVLKPRESRELVFQLRRNDFRWCARTKCASWSPVTLPSSSAAALEMPICSRTGLRLPSRLTKVNENERIKQREPLLKTVPSYFASNRNQYLLSNPSRIMVSSTSTKFGSNCLPLSRTNSAQMYASLCLAR